MTVLQARRAAHQVEGRLAAAVREALRIMDAQKAEGVPLAERVRGLDAVLRAVWPRGRADAWHTLCAQCDDYGLQIGWCGGDTTCGRQVPHLPHTVGTPCRCAKGARYQPKPKASADFKDAGRTKPTRVGR